MAREQINLAEQVSGTLPPGNGGTGATSLSGAGIEQTAYKNAANGYAGLNSSAAVAVANGGTGATSASAALTGLGAQPSTSAVSGSNDGTAAALTLWIGTTAQYNALGSYSATTVYICT